MPTSKRATDKRARNTERNALNRAGHRTAPEPVTEAQREHGAGRLGRLAGPRPPDETGDVDTPILGVVPPDPNMPDEVGDMDLMRGDPTRVREAPRGSATTEGEEAAAEALRRKLHREGASEVSED